MATQARILLFHTPVGLTKQIEQLARPLSIRIVSVPTASYQQTLGCLAGISGFHKTSLRYSGADFDHPMLVFSGMDSSLTDQFLDAYRNASLPVIGRKAIVTPHNIFWDPLTLYRELDREHQRLHVPLS